MSELFEDGAEKEVIAEEEVLEDAEEVIVETKQKPTSDARRRLEDLLEEKRLRDELEDFTDY